MPKQNNALGATDIRHHFHSQTDPRVHQESGPFVLTRGEGINVFDDSGRRYIEGMSGLWYAALGFSNGRIQDAVSRQIRTLPCYHTFNHRSNDVCIKLAESIADLVPMTSPKVFFVSSGSEANDTMVKMAWYYHRARGRPNKRKIISRGKAFHGSTVMGAAMSGLPHMHESFNLPTDDIIFVGCPHFYRHGRDGESEDDFCERLVRELEDTILQEGADNIAAMIAEPIMGAGGVIVPPPGYFERIQAILRKFDILMLVDEIICGFGRTGRWFGAETFGIEPDMMSLAKGLSSGYLPVGATVISGDVYEVIAEEATRLGVFGHGFTYSGHPVTAAAALEAVDIYKEMNVPSLTSALGNRLHASLERLRDHALVGDVRGTGLIAGIELDCRGRSSADAVPDGKLGALVADACRNRGLIVRNMGDTIALCPPFIIEPHEIDEIVDRLRDAIDSVSHDVV